MTRTKELALCALFGTVIGAAIFGGPGVALAVIAAVVTVWAGRLVFWKAERWQDAYRARLAAGSMHQHNGRPCYGQACRPIDWSQEDAA